MKKLILVGAVAALALVPASASAHSSSSYQKACHNDGYGSITGLYAGKKPGLSCSGAIKVMNHWFDRDDCWEGTCRVRVGYAGWLWKCEGWRRPNQLKIYDVWCYSGKKAYVRYGKYGSYESRTVHFVYTD